MARVEPAGRSRGGRQPYAWLGVGALGLGLGAVLSAGLGVAHAEGGRGDSGSASRSADAVTGPVASRRGGGAPVRGSSGAVTGSASRARADGVVRGGVPRTAAARSARLAVPVSTRAAVVPTPNALSAVVPTPNALWGAGAVPAGVVSGPSARVMGSAAGKLGPVLGGL